MQRPLSSRYRDYLREINIPGVSGLVWERELLLDFLNSDESSNYAILGGDVLRVVGGQMEYTYDNWFVSGKRHPSETFQNYVARCNARAVEYISAYPIKKGIVFSLVMSSEVTAGLMFP